MPEFRKTLAVFCLFLAAGFQWGCTRKTDVWVTLVNGMPEKVFTAGASRNVVYYVLKQTHEPLLRREDSQNYTSRVLKSWRRNINNTEFAFYPDTSLQFNPGHPFSVEVFEEYLSGLVKRYSSSARIHRENGGLIINFPQAQDTFLDFLTEYENAPSIKASVNIEDGLGPFRVVSLEKNTLALERKIPVSRGYNKILIVEQAAQKNVVPDSRNISDFNRIPLSDIPDWAKQEYLSFNNVVLKSGNLIINHHDKEMRELIYNCIDVKEFRAAFFPARKEFRSIKTVLPIGVPGALSGEPEQACGRFKNIKLSSKKIILANWRSDNLVELKAFSDSFKKKTGINLQLLNSSPAELIKVLHKSPRPYHLIPMHFDAVRPEPAIFLEPFFKRDGYLDFALPELEPLYKRMLSEGAPGKRAELGGEIALKLRDNAVVLSLYQDERPVYYPGEIKNINVGKGFSEYPEIADFRW